MRIKLSTRITGGDIQRGQVADSRYLDVIGSLNEVGSLYRSRWNEASSVSGLAGERQEVESILRVRLTFRHHATSYCWVGKDGRKDQGEALPADLITNLRIADDGIWTRVRWRKETKVFYGVDCGACGISK